MVIKRFVLLLLPLAGCVAVMQVEDVITLPPPQKVRSQSAGQKLTIFWQAGPEAHVPGFNGYLLYVSPRSMAGLTLADLPAPIAINRGLTSHTLTVGDSLTLFIQVRSRVGRNRISLPSLPELVIKPATP
ncbi:MAG: hypothetical protein ONB48_05710 [candidate division KSB1 bacterium]|nr:hypothetical protein [candidate division KSB1 bacterium]MDZ7273044.1 hypothetical protein [candidate division KSB1 bacterium]MDZ7285147.1 hypothetical protein [candidate division KSB1 bacterium]MDZ7298179.1 hypothetical protein [candidate division KSB1 bacterium]MDZ7307845.1 hypothetical protein [candidate division KSB1 bacterium]